jgi:hypothetical protein
VAIKQCGLSWAWSKSEVNLLDWDLIIGALVADALLTKGPRVGPVQYWLLRYGLISDSSLLSQSLLWLVGPGWLDAVHYQIRRSAVGGPRIANHRLLRAAEAFRDLRHAFRLADEPTPWIRRRQSNRKVRRETPPMWRTLPWICPTDLQDRSFVKDHPRLMGEDDEVQQALAMLELIGNKAGGYAGVAALERALVRINGLRRLYGSS